MAGNLEQLFGGGFDPNEVDTSGGMGVIPDGQYLVMVQDADLVDTQKGGKQIKVAMPVVGGAYDGAVLYERINVENTNQKAVEMGFKVLARMVSAAGISVLRDTSELIGKKFIVEVVIEKGTGTYVKDGEEKTVPDRNKITKYHPSHGIAANTATTKAQASQSEPAPSGEKKMPWAK